MKKNVLALSISAALIGLGFAGGAQAITDVGIGSGTAIAVSANAVGHNLVVPYYTANGANKTQINIVNSDLINGKAVKIRFRAASNSDDVFDFQLFLSPGDVWSGEVSQDATTGLAKLASGDKSCTKPSIAAATPANLLFKTDRLDNTSPTATATTRAAQTREGYVEILTMADIRPLNHTVDANGLESILATANGLFTQIKHVAGVAPCGTGATAASWTAIDTNTANLTSAALLGLARPTGTIAANWTILNTTTSSAYGGQATALAITGPAVAVAAVGGTAGLNTGNLTYWPQAPLSSAFLNAGGAVLASVQQTADPLLRTVLSTGNPTVAPTMVDLPDLSTPFLGQVAAQNTAITGPIAAANALSLALAKTSVSNEFLTTVSFNASTDWTFSMPSRRYGVVYNYIAGTALFNTTAGTDVTTIGTASNFFQSGNAVTNASRRMVCVNNITPASFDREETTGSTIIFSPAVAPTLCGEVSVLSINNAASLTSNSLLAVNTLNDVDATYREGWLSVATPGIGAGLPIIGHSFVRAFSGTINIGAAYAHR
jgi:hypothetical protein